MDNLKQIITNLQVEDKRLQSELKRVRGALLVLRRLNGSAAVSGARPRRRLSAAARKKIADAQRARWAKWKAKKAA
ncbi:MAG TPA: hypothetical protein VGF06_08605 [Terriglobales bacterium]|jgi:hypothetical protein